MIRVKINGKQHEVEVDPETPLLWVIRDHIGYSGTKFGCGIGECGACTVHVDGAATRSCSLPVGDVPPGAEITTIEGLGGHHPVQKAWIAEDVPQCGYCQSGMIMATVALLRDKPAVTDADIDENLTNICRCGSYPRIRKAIHRVAAQKAEG